MAKTDRQDLSLTLDEGTFYLVGEILRAERGLDKIDFEIAGEAIRGAMERLRAKPERPVP